MENTIEDAIETVRLLVVSRESAVLRPLWSIGEANRWRLETAVSGWEAMERIHSGVAPHLLVLDVPHGDSDSLHVLRWLRRLRPDLPVIVLCCADGAVEENEAIRLCAQEILPRPIDPDHLESLIRKHLVPSTVITKAEVSSADLEPLGEDRFFVSASPVTHRLRAQAELLAQADVPALILGEPGSGKDTVARLIHKFSVRSGFRFLKVNCAAMPGELLEAMLCGHPTSSGLGEMSFATEQTGQSDPGEKGTILLDEITEMPLSLQAKLIQMLQEKPQFRPSGNGHGNVGVRILASSTANLERALAEKKMREDLYYRLSAFAVTVPPLRQRKEEIAILLRHFMHKLANRYGLAPRELSSPVLAACRRYSWPGNLKELETFVKRYLIAGDSDLGFHQPGFGQTGPQEAETGVHAGGIQESSILPEAAWGNGDGRADSRKRNGESQASAAPHSLKNLIRSVTHEAERNAISAALQRTGWNRKAAARLLKVSYRTLLYKIEQYHMHSPERYLSSLPSQRFSDADSEAGKEGKAS